MSDFWTKDAIDQLKDLWLEFSASQIQRIMGAPSRNAVLAKANRLVAKGELGPKATNNRPFHFAPRERTISPKITVALPPPVVEPEAAATNDGAAITVLNVLHHQCRWPIGDPREADFHFCGHKKRSGSPYCPFHTARAWAPAAKRVRSS